MTVLVSLVGTRFGLRIVRIVVGTIWIRRGHNQSQVPLPYAPRIAHRSELFARSAGSGGIILLSLGHRAIRISFRYRLQTPLPYKF